ncbi:hypothetical protein YPPY59_4678, partial [Yersinia pestis PY-59]
MWHGLGGENV